MENVVVQVFISGVSTQTTFSSVAWLVGLNLTKDRREAPIALFSKDNRLRLLSFALATSLVLRKS